MDEVRIDVSLAAANWLWLVPSISFESAIFVGPASSPMLAALRLQIEQVHAVAPGDEASLAAIRASKVSWAFVDLDFARHERAQLGPLLIALEAALRGGGNLCLACRARDGRMIHRMAASWRLGRALKLACRAGFAVAGRYYALPDPDAPLSLVPASRDGASTFESLAEPVPGRRLRLGLARSFLHPLLFRGHLCLCCA